MPTRHASGLSSVPFWSVPTLTYLGRTLRVPSLILPSLLSCSLSSPTPKTGISIWFYSALKPCPAVPAITATSAAMSGFPSLSPGCFSGPLGLFAFPGGTFGHLWESSLINQHWGLRRNVSWDCYSDDSPLSSSGQTCVPVDLHSIFHSCSPLLLGWSLSPRGSRAGNLVPRLVLR